MPKLKENQFYCVSCRRTKKGHDIYVERDRNGRPRLVAVDNYDHPMFKYISFDKELKLKKKYN